MKFRIFSVSLDFGTCSSGFGYAFKHGDLMIHTEYPGAPTLVCPKTTTALLYNCTPNMMYDAPKAWGWDAHSQYMKMKPAERSNNVYVDNFKLALAPSMAVYSTCYQPRPDLPTDKLLADFLREMKNMAISVLQKR